MRLEALLAALGELFGPRLGFRVGGDGGVVFLWDGQVDGWVGLAESDPQNVAGQLLSTAQDLWLRGLGEEGTDPGAWATASPEVSCESFGLTLSLRGERGVLASVHVALT